MKAKNRPLCFIILTILVASCLPTPPTKSQELLTDTPQAVTIAATATIFPTATPTRAPIPTTTPLPSIIPGHWAEKGDGSFDAGKMFPLVGAIDEKHHNLVDLSYNGLKVAVVTVEDVSQKDASSYADFKNQQATEINNNIDLQSQLDQLKSLIDQNNLDKYTVIVGNGAIEWIVDQRSDIRTYQKLENSLLEETEVQLLPKIEVRGNKFYRLDTGEEVRFAGIMIDMTPKDAVNEQYEKFNTLFVLLGLIPNTLG